MSVFDEIAALFARHGDDAYFGEPVTQTEHALQTAHHAESESAPDTLVVAALLHDVGHLLHDSGEDAADHGIDTRHEIVGDAWLSARFGPAVCEPGRLHVDAKRYLCAVDADYLAQLSPASVQSLALQGGPMDAVAVAAFESNPFFRDAVRLRRWDDAAKIPGLAVPNLAHYRTRIEAQAIAAGDA